MWRSVDVRAWLSTSIVGWFFLFCSQVFLLPCVQLKAFSSFAFISIVLSTLRGDVPRLEFHACSGASRYFWGRSEKIGAGSRC